MVMAVSVTVSGSYGHRGGRGRGGQHLLNSLLVVVLMVRQALGGRVWESLRKGGGEIRDLGETDLLLNVVLVVLILQERDLQIDLEGD